MVMRYLKLKITLFTIVFVLILSLTSIKIKSFIITKKSEDKIVYVDKIKDNEKIIFSYIHSVSKTPIKEILYINGENISLQEVRYIDQGGAGMPEFTWDDEKFEKEGNEFVIKNFKRYFDHIPITVQKDYRDKLTFENKTLKLDEIISGNGIADIKVRDLSILEFFIYKFEGL
ncbi:hypothetical protein SH2C18_41280 [Clostridium sediminicola]|uniref:DUF1850 domain-containing protein n=1 Tax=Clostridium sediminicola TaxID=3114879 RepID=UPI0031F1D0F1